MDSILSMEDLPLTQYTREEWNQMLGDKVYTKCGEIVRHNESFEINYVCWVCLERMPLVESQIRDHIQRHFNEDFDNDDDSDDVATRTVGMKIECAHSDGDYDEFFDDSEGNGGDDLDAAVELDASYHNYHEVNQSVNEDDLPDRTHVFEMTVDDIDLDGSDGSDDEPEFTVTCDCCTNVKYPCKGMLKEHLIERQQNFPVFRCDECAGTYMSTHELRMHKTIHDLPEVEIVECRFCATVFSSKAELRNHCTEGTKRKSPVRRIQSPLPKVIEDEPADEEETAGACALPSPHLVTSMLRIEKPNAGEELDSNESSSESNGENDTANDMVDADESSQQSHDDSVPTVTLQCDRCAQIFRYPETNNDGLREHQKRCMETKPAENCKPTLQCPVCSSEFRCNKSYIDHVLSVHSGDSSVQDVVCAICKNWYSEYDELAEHMRSEHATTDADGDVTSEKLQKNRQFQCHLCEKAFTRRQQFQEHLKRTHKNAKAGNFECSVCKKIFKNRDNLLQHQRTHSGEKPYECGICHKRFNHSSYINIHMRTHTKERPFACQICDKDFISRSKLTAHMKAHNDVRPHKCDECDRTFRTPADMRNHYRAEHTNERPFECHICGNNFAKQKLLNQHLFLHQVKKHFKCRYCPLAFSQPAGRHGHEKRIHRV